MSDFKLFCLIFQPPVTAIPASSQSETVAVKQEKMVSHVRNSRAYSKASLYSSLGYLWTSSLTKERTSSETSREEEKSLFRRLHYQHLNSSNCFCISPEGEFEFWSRLCLGAFVIKPLVERVL